MQKRLLTTAILGLFSLTATSAPLENAGSISRQVEQRRNVELSSIQNMQTMPQTMPQSPAQTAGTKFRLNAINLQGNNLLSETQLQPIYSEYIGKDVSLGDLQIMAQKINQLYAQAGYPLVSVVVPAQSVENGVVSLSVVESQVGNVEINNQSRLKNSVVQSHLKNINTNGSLNQAKSERALLLLKDMAGTDEVNYRLTGAENATNISVDLSPAPLLNGFVSAENYGSKSTGRARGRAGINLNSPLGYGEKISAQAMSSFKGVDYGQIGVDLPIGNQGFSIGTNLSHTKYDLGGAFKDLDATGNSTSVAGTFYYPILRSNQHNIWLNGGVESKNLRDEIGATDTITRKRINSGNIGLGATFRDNALAGGITQLNITNTFGNLKFKDEEAKEIDKISAKTAGNYYKFNFSLGRTQYFNPKISAYLGVQGQLASKNLDSAEQLSLGGADAVAAYHSNDVSVDEGLIGQLQLRYAINPNASIYGFYDVGSGSLSAKPYLKGVKNSTYIQGGGVGVDADYKGFNFSGKVAWHGHESDNVEANKNPQFWIKAGYRF